MRASIIVTVLVFGTASIDCSRPPRAEAPGRSRAALPEGYMVMSGRGWSVAVPERWRPRRQNGRLQLSVRGQAALAGTDARVRLETEPFEGTASAFARTRAPMLGGTAVVIGQREAAVGALPAQDVEAIWTDTRPWERGVQRYAVSNGIGFVLSCSAASAVFERVRPVCGIVLGSFRLEPGEIP